MRAFDPAFLRAAALVVPLVCACAQSRADVVDAATRASAADIDTDTDDVFGPGHWRLQAARWSSRFGGYRLATNASTLAAPPTLRVALGERVELHASADSRAAPLALESSPDALRHLHGYTDVSFGARWRVRGGDAGWLPGVAWLADVDSISGSPAFRGRDIRPSLRATAEWALPHDFSLGVMPGVVRDRDDTGRRYAAGLLAVTLGKAWTPRLHTFAEVVGERVAQPSSSMPRGASSLTFDTGFAFAVTQALRFDIVASHGLSGAAPGMQGGVSVSSRF